MKNQELIKQKKLKTRMRRKDFIKKRNVRRNNTQTPIQKEIVPTIQLLRDVDGKIIYEKKKAQYTITGEKTVTRKLYKSLLSPGDGILPKRVKPKEKKEKTKK